MLPLISPNKHTYTEVYNNEYVSIDDIITYLKSKGLKPGDDYTETKIIGTQTRVLYMYHPIWHLYNVICNYLQIVDDAREDLSTITYWMDHREEFIMYLTLRDHDFDVKYVRWIYNKCSVRKEE